MSSRASGLVDLHAHVLPDVDDGPGTLEDALRLLEAMLEQGVATVAATSHVAASFPNRSSDLASARLHLVEAVNRASMPIRVVGGAEIELQMAMTLPDEELKALRIEDTRWLLLETPHARYPAGLGDVVADLRGRGHEVLLAHPERNPHVQDNIAPVEAAVANGALVQLTGASLRGILGRRVEQTAWQLLDAGLGHVIASDAHDVRARPPDNRSAADVIASQRDNLFAEATTRAAPSAIVADERAADIKALVDGVRPSRALRRRWLVARR